MLGKGVNEIVITPKDDSFCGELNWGSASAITKELVNNGYAVMTTLEENLIIINYVDAAYDRDFNYGQSNRNNVTFMGNDEFEDDYAAIKDLEGNEPCETDEYFNNCDVLDLPEPTLVLN